MDQNHNQQGSHVESHHHHILTDKMIFSVGAALLVLTAVTVWVGYLDLGRFNMVIAMAIASVKASFVAMIFMNLKYDRKENSVIFFSSFLFLAIFFILTGSDIFFRGDVYVKGALGGPASTAKSHLKNPWISTPELVAKGHDLFMQQCVACHGPQGKGDGPAAAALNPHPRNFTSNEGWVNGRKESMVFKTLKEGIPGSGMASFSTLPADDRWALDAYVLSLGPTKPAADTPADFAKAGIDTKGGGAEAEVPSIPIDMAMERMAVPESK